MCVWRGQEKDPCRTACSEAEQPCSLHRAGAPGLVSATRVDRFQEPEAMPSAACGSSVGLETCSGSGLTFTGDGVDLNLTPCLHPISSSLPRGVSSTDSPNLCYHAPVLCEVCIWAEMCPSGFLPFPCLRGSLPHCLPHTSSFPAAWRGRAVLSPLFHSLGIKTEEQ